MQLTIAVVNYRVHDRYILTPVSIPTVGVGSFILTLARASNINIVEHDITRIRNEMVVLGAVTQRKVGHHTILQPIDTDQDWP